MSARTFREACCERLGFPPTAFEEEVLRRCLYPHARWLPGLLRRDFFADDLELIRSVADCTALDEIRMELNNHRYHKPISGFLRRVLRLRLSGHRLMVLGARVLHPHGPASHGG